MTVIGSDQDIPFPDYTEKLEYEPGFGVYIGKYGVKIPEEDAPALTGG